MIVSYQKKVKRVDLRSNEIFFANFDKNEIQKRFYKQKKMLTNSVNYRNFYLTVRKMS